MRSDTAPRERPAPARTFVERARRRQLVEAAIDQLAEAGYPGTSLAAVAARAQVSKPSVLYHFTGGKDELMDEVVATVLTAAEVAMTAAVEPETTVLGRLRAYITANVAFLDAHRHEILALIAIFTGAARDDSGATRFDAVGEQAVDELARLLRAGQRTGDFGDFDALVVARSLRGAIDALAPVLRQEPGPDLDAYAAELAAMAERAVAP